MSLLEGWAISRRLTSERVRSLPPGELLPLFKTPDTASIGAQQPASSTDDAPLAPVTPHAPPAVPLWRFSQSPRPRTRASPVAKHAAAKQSKAAAVVAEGEAISSALCAEAARALVSHRLRDLAEEEEPLLGAGEAATEQPEVFFSRQLEQLLADKPLQATTADSADPEVKAEEAASGGEPTARSLMLSIAKGGALRCRVTGPQAHDCCEPPTPQAAGVPANGRHPPPQRHRQVIDITALAVPPAATAASLLPWAEPPSLFERAAEPVVAQRPDVAHLAPPIPLPASIDVIVLDLDDTLVLHKADARLSAWWSELRQLPQSRDTALTQRLEGDIVRRLTPHLRFFRALADAAAAAGKHLYIASFATRSYVTRVVQIIFGNRIPPSNLKCFPYTYRTHPTVFNKNLWLQQIEEVTGAAARAILLVDDNWGNVLTAKKGGYVAFNVDSHRGLNPSAWHFIAKMTDQRLVR